MSVPRSTLPVILLGSTGSIGCQTLEVCGRYGIPVLGLGCQSSIERLEEQIRSFHPAAVAVEDRDAARILADRLAHTPFADCVVHGGDGAACRLAGLPGPAIVVQAMVGMAGIQPVLAAIAAGHKLAIANKEVLVSAGSLVQQACRRAGIVLRPIDSEHSAIWQALSGSPPREGEPFYAKAASGDRHPALRRVILTASGGPFYGSSLAELAAVTPAAAVAHPTWAMGAKISVDSATMMNKGLEMIEAACLFGLGAAEIDAVIHPQSIIHSFVEWTDGSVLAQLGFPDMCQPIQFALSYPERWPHPERRWDPLDPSSSRLDFAPLDEAVFPATALARECLRRGGSHPLALNAANEVAVAAFLAGKIAFPAIMAVVTAVLEGRRAGWEEDATEMAQVLELDSEARRLAAAAVRGLGTAGN
ncbi:MAG: 1-deoxy-D-xylulose-5-phosphate reductoisomerase [Bacillota bacterium]|nr:1-deoxy-D-xylulose-5-phosphate reductoisomerase [Bacillota bacterium]